MCTKHSAEVVAGLFNKSTTLRRTWQRINVVSQCLVTSFSLQILVVRICFSLNITVISLFNVFVFVFFFFHFVVAYIIVLMMHWCHWRCLQITFVRFIRFCSQNFHIQTKSTVCRTTFLVYEKCIHLFIYKYLLSIVRTLLSIYLLL